MEELTIEQKAQRYDEAIKVAKSKIKNNKDRVLYEEDITDIFPEFRKSEDEEVKKALIKNLKERFGTKGTMGGILDMPRVLAWLERQSEQKPIEWSEEDEWKFADILALLRGGENCHYNTPDLFTWFKSLKDRIQPQPKQEWSEEDKKYFDQAIYICHQNNYTAIENWLQSLRPQKQWKPSGEQMKFLHKYAEQNNYDGAILTSLYNDLKKLKE